MKCAIFDLDGTLLYTLEDLYNATNYALNYFGYKERTLQEVRNFVGNGIAKLIERALGENYNKDEATKCLEIFRDYYSKYSQRNTKPYKGIVNLLEKLSIMGIKTAVNSNKYDSAVKELCQKYFNNLVLVAVGESESCPRKPDPTGVNTILEFLGCNRENAIYIGDSLVDIQTAKNAQIPCVSVTWGYCDVGVLKSNNNLIANNTDELLDLIINNINGL